MTMLPSEIEIELGLDEADDAEAIRRKAARRIVVSPAALVRPTPRKRSIASPRGRVVFRPLP